MPRVTGFTIFLCSVVGYFHLKFILFWVSEVIQFVVSRDRKMTGSPMLETRCRESVKMKIQEIIEDH